MSRRDTGSCTEADHKAHQAKILAAEFGGASK